MSRFKRFERYRDWWDRLCQLGGRLTLLSSRGRRGSPAYAATRREYDQVLAQIRTIQAGTSVTALTPGA